MSIETVRSNSENFESSELDKVVQETDSQIWSVLEEEYKYSTPDFLVSKVKELNPNVKFEVDEDRSIIFSSECVENLFLPEWFYYNQKNWITNKHNTKSGIYVSVQVYPIEYYDPRFI